MLGLRDDTFAAWRRTDDGWSKPHPFGRLDDAAGRSPYVASLAGDASGFWATTSDGSSYALWHSADGEDWTQVVTPAKPPGPAGEHVLAVAAAEDTVLVLADDGESARLWWTDDPPSG